MTAAFHCEPEGIQEREQYRRSSSHWLQLLPTVSPQGAQDVKTQDTDAE